MRKLTTLVLTLGAMMLVGPTAQAVNHVGTWYACSITGNQSPPAYGLRLDGFFDGNSGSAVTFHYDNVLFQSTAAGTARLWGQISVAEANSNPGTVGQTYMMDVNFVTAGPAGDIVGYQPTWDYYNIDPGLLPEITRIGDATDVTNMWTHPTDNPGVTPDQKPFRIGNPVGGAQANGKNNNFGASGWVNYEHSVGGSVYGYQTSHFSTADFLMDLKPVPEPGTLMLFGLGLAGGARALRRRRNKA